MQPSAKRKNSLIVSARAPVLSRTGTVLSSASRTSATVFTSGSLPAIGPDTKMTSARLETTVDRLTRMVCDCRCSKRTPA